MLFSIPTSPLPSTLLFPTSPQTCILTPFSQLGATKLIEDALEGFETSSPITEYPISLNFRTKESIQGYKEEQEKDI